MSTLERLVYTSRETDSMGTLALFNLLNAARIRNEQLELTGLLVYVDGGFTQCIEGPTASINKLWKSLLRDTRHQDISLIEREQVSSRRYPDWRMAFSSYRYLNTFNMPGFFPIDQPGGVDLKRLTGHSLNQLNRI